MIKVLCVGDLTNNEDYHKIKCTRTASKIENVLYFINNYKNIYLCLIFHTIIEYFNLL